HGALLLPRALNRLPSRPSLFPYTTLFRSKAEPMDTGKLDRWLAGKIPRRILVAPFFGPIPPESLGLPADGKGRDLDGEYFHPETDRKSTRLNSSHDQTSYAVFCLKKKNYS